MRKHANHISRRLNRFAGKKGKVASKVLDFAVDRHKVFDNIDNTARKIERGISIGQRIRAIKTRKPLE